MMMIPGGEQLDWLAGAEVPALSELLLVDISANQAASIY